MAFLEVALVVGVACVGMYVLFAPTEINRRLLADEPLWFWPKR